MSEIDNFEHKHESDCESDCGSEYKIKSHSLNFIAIQKSIEPGSLILYDVYTKTDGSIEPVLVGFLKNYTIESTDIRITGLSNMTILDQIKNMDKIKNTIYNFVWSLKTDLINERIFLSSPVILTTSNESSTKYSYNANVHSINETTLSIIITANL
jgi:hypothetical protein